MTASCPISGPIAIVCARKQVNELWAKACQYDNINPESTTVVFSVDNPYSEAFDKAVLRYERMIQLNRAGTN